MLNLDDQNLATEVAAAVDWRKRHLLEMEEQVRKYHGSAYLDDHLGSGRDPENYAFSFISLVLPRLANDVPRIQVEAQGDQGDDGTAAAIELAMNTWATRSHLRRTIERIAVEMIFTWGAAMVTPEPVESMRRIEPGHGGRTPRVYRIAPDRLVIDPAATDLSDARYVGHQYVTDLDDLLDRAENDPYLDVAAIEGLQASDDDMGSEGTISSRSGRNVPDREEVIVTEIWVPDGDTGGIPEQQHLYNGVLIRLASTASEDFRVISAEPEPYYGPSTGPYTLVGAYTVPGDVYPLGTLTAAQGLLQELNSHLKSMHTAAGAYRRLVLVDSRGTKLAQDIANSPDLHVVPVENIDRDRVVPIEVGGVTQQQIQYTAMTQDRLDRLTGMNEVIRGLVTGDATATEVQTAATSSGLRISWMQRCFAEAIDQMMYTVAWYMYHDDQIEMPLSRAEADRAMVGTTFRGGVFKEDFDSYAVRVSAYSLERTSEALQQKRALELLQLVLQVGQAVPAMPFVRWNRLLEMIGDQLNMPQLKDVVGTPGAAQAGPAPGTTGAAPGSAPADMGSLMASDMRGVSAGGGRASIGR